MVNSLGSTSLQSNVPIRTMHGPWGQASYLDANSNNRYDAGDSVILSDINGDGKYDSSDANGTSKILNLMKDTRNPNIDDVKGMGIFPNNRAERNEARIWNSMAHKVDPDRDGAVLSHEMGPCGSRRLILANDRNGDGQYTGQDLHAGGPYWLNSLSPSSANITVSPPPAAWSNLRSNALTAK